MSDFTPHTGIDWRGDGWGSVRYGAGNQVVLFYNRSVHNPAKSTAEGRPVFDDKVFFKSFVPGEQRFNIVDRPATTAEQQRYPREWAAYKENAEQTPEGTPIDMLYPEKPSIAATLKANGVHTIEQCAVLGATSIDNIGMGCQAWVNEASEFLKIAQKGVSATQYRKEKDQLKGEIKVLMQQLDILKAEVERLRTTSQHVDPSEVQRVLAGMMAHPTMPVQPRGQTFDAQTAQINATHATADITRQKKTRRKPAAR